MSRPLRPAGAKSGVHDLAGRPAPLAGSQTGTAQGEHEVDWGDYVVVDAIDGQELTVHTTRDPRGHDTSPYRVLVTPDTIVDRSDPAYGGTVIAGVYDGVEPGDRFYFVGNALTQGPRFVQAVRIFPFDS